MDVANITFSHIVDLPAGNYFTWCIAAADVNADGMMDIIFGNSNHDNQLLLNDGEGGFSEAVDLPGGILETYSIAVADINNDGLVDIIIGSITQKNQLLLNDGDGIYSKAVDLPGGYTYTKSIAVADVNNDGMVDIIIGNYNQTNQLLISNDFGSYFDVVVLPGGDMTTFSVAAADVNNDGMVDIIIGDGGYPSPQKNQLLLNNGFGNYLNVVELPGGDMSTRFIVAADVNNDGMVDISIGTNSDQRNRLLLNNGAGGYSEAVDLPGGTKETRSIAVADINGDGMVDIVVGNYGGKNQLLLNDGNGTYLEAVDLPGGYSSTTSIAVVDVNYNGMADIITGNVHDNNQWLPVSTLAANTPSPTILVPPLAPTTSGGSSIWLAIVIFMTVGSVAVVGFGIYCYYKKKDNCCGNRENDNDYDKEEGPSPPAPSDHYNEEESASLTAPALKPPPSPPLGSNITIATTNSNRFHAFLTHNWGEDNESRNNHKRVIQFKNALQSCGIQNLWLDEERMTGDIIKQMCNGIDQSGLIIVFITQNYIEKVAGRGPKGDNDNCLLEFNYANRKKGSSKLIAVVMEESCSDSNKWDGPIGMILGGHLYYSFKKDSDLMRCADEVAAEIRSRLGESEFVRIQSTDVSN